MRSPASPRALMFFVIVLIVGPTAVARAADPDWKAVEQALGTSGPLQAGDVFRVGMPRTDLAVTVKGVAVNNAGTLARGLKAALDQTNSQK